MGESVIAEIVEIIAEEEGDDPTAVDFSLHEHIDTDAIHLLMDHQSSSWTLTFDVDGYEVVLSGDGVVQVDRSRSELNV